MVFIFCFTRMHYFATIYFTTVATIELQVVLHELPLIHNTKNWM